MEEGNPYIIENDEDLRKLSEGTKSLWSWPCIVGNRTICCKNHYACDTGGQEQISVVRISEIEVKR